jgi:nicotinamidase/pyrazinamidase
MNTLLLVDIQNDFLPGGALPVPEGDRIIPIVNTLMPRFDLVLATQDWHPPNHVSFAANHPGTNPGETITHSGLPQILWPVHCVQGTPGAELARGLDISRIGLVFQKGIDPDIDSYSGFFDNGRRRSTGLAEDLQARAITSIYLCGLATDYCVDATALDGRREGFTVTLIEDACRGVNLRPGDAAAAIGEMRQAGVRVLRSAEVAGDLARC